MSAGSSALPTWWAEQSPRLASHVPVPLLIQRGVRRFDAEAAAAQLCDNGFAVVDNFLGAAPAAAVRTSIQDLDAAGALRLGRLQHGTQQSTNNETRSDRILPTICAVQAKRQGRSQHRRV